MRTSAPRTVAGGRTGLRGGEDRSFQRCTLCSALPEPPSLVGTGISSAAAGAAGQAFLVECCGDGWFAAASPGSRPCSDGDEHFQRGCLCWEGVPSSAGRCGDQWPQWDAGTGLALPVLHGMWTWYGGGGDGRPVRDGGCPSGMGWRWAAWRGLCQAFVCWCQR